MSNSPLVNYTKLSPYCTKPRNKQIKGISIHTMAGPGSVEGCGQVFQTTRASSHYGIGPDGRIGQYVREEDRAWCCSHAVDHSVVTIEVSSIQAYKEPYACTDEAYAALIDLCTDICRRNGIKKLLWVEGKENCPAHTGRWDVCNMVPHRYTTDKGKSCPGNYLFGRYGDIAEKVNDRLAGQMINKEDELDMTIDQMIEEMTPEQAYKLAQKAELHAKTLPEPAWSRKEGHWQRAADAGVMDGTAPERYVRRDELAAVLGRKWLI